MTYMTEEESIDIEDLNEKMQTFSQDLLELNAMKSNLPNLKERITQFVVKRTTVMLTLNRLARQMISQSENSAHRIAEMHTKALEQHDARLRTLCTNVEQ